MKNPLPKIAAFALLWGCAALPTLASAQPPVAAPKAPAALEIQISASVSENGEKCLALDPLQPHFSVVLRNASDKPIQLFQEGNSWGYANLHLEITAIDGKKMPFIGVVGKRGGFWSNNFPSIETLAPHQMLVREVYLHLPARFQHSEKSVKASKSRDDNDPRMNEYGGFFFPTAQGRKVLTMKAVFEVTRQEATANQLAWKGHVESEPFAYIIRWGAPRL